MDGIYPTYKIWPKSIKLPSPMAVLPANLKTSRVLILGFVVEKADVLPISTFKYDIPQPYCFDIKIIADIVHIPQRYVYPR